MALRLIIGDDPVLVGEAVIAAVDELVGTGDRSLMLETLTEADYRNDSGGYEPSKVLDAVRTPPFLTDRRVVVGRHLSRFSKKEDYLPIVDLLAEPLETTDLVLVWEKGVDPKVDRMPSLPKAIKEAAEVAGALVQHTAAPKGKAAGTGCVTNSDRARCSSNDLQLRRSKNCWARIGAASSASSAPSRERLVLMPRSASTTWPPSAVRPVRRFHGRSTTRSTEETLLLRCNCCPG